MSDPEFLAWLATQVDSWLWDNVPSAAGFYIDIVGSLGVVGEGELGAQGSLLFNWRSGELTFFYGPEAGGYIGTPRGGSISASGGSVFAFGASRNDYLKGISAYYGGVLGVDVFAEAGLKLTGSSALHYSDVNDNGRFDLGDKTVVFNDPVSGRPVSALQVGVGAGINTVPTGLEGGAVGGLSATEGFNIIPGWNWGGWPWNWCY